MTVLVVIHHAIINYTYYGHADAKTWLGFDGTILATDSFFMALFFFLSGLFVWPSLQRRSTLSFLGERMLRLALPFAVAALLLMPLAYYALELRQSNIGFAEFWWKTVTVGPWPSGPVWFLWILLLLGFVAAILFHIAPNCLAPLNRLSVRAFTQPFRFFIVFLAVTTLAYVPMRMIFGVNHWFEFGPFAVQASRALLYPACFFLGAGVGLANVENGLLSHQGMLMRRWWAWALAALASYSVIVALVYYRRGILPDPDALPQWWQYAYAFAFPLFSAAMGFAVMAWFLRFDRPGTGFLDLLQPAAYGIFLIHYVPILWIQYWLRNADLSVFAKAGISFVFALGVSWLVTLALLRLPGAKRVL
jgi:hypothetical protein